MKDLLNQMIWIIPQEEENYFFAKRLGRSHTEGIDEDVYKRQYQGTLMYQLCVLPDIRKIKLLMLLGMVKIV